MKKLLAHWTFVPRLSAAIIAFSVSYISHIDAGQAQPSLQLTVSGSAVTVFAKSHDACDALDIPDAPARAIRGVSGNVQLYVPHFSNRRLVGPDLLNLKNDCQVVFAGGERDDPAAFDDRGWITSLYTSDGKTIYAAIHNEFQGNRRPSLCPSGQYLNCWYNSITAAISGDGGKTFARVSKDSDLIAEIPYRYIEATGQHVGYFNPSNMALVDGLLYMMVFTTEVFAQKPGNCLLRTAKIMDPSAWRGWDGKAFGTTFINPYTFQGPRDTHVCAPVGNGRLRWPVTSLVKHMSSGLFIALMMNADRNGGIYYATSSNLIDWSQPSKLMNAAGEGAYQCGDPAPLAYPSLLDPKSTDRNFMLVKQSPVLFLTRFNVSGCKTSMDRDLIRIPITISITGG